MDIANALPADCIAQIISLTTPRDACRLAAVSPFFRSLADSDTVWENFLAPSEYEDIVLSGSASDETSPVDSLSKKGLYAHLCQNPIIINNGTMSFALDQESGKKCYMIGARGLSITWENSLQYWKWLTDLPKSRFPEVAQLKFVMWFEIIGSIDTKILSPNTTYVAYLIFKFADMKHWFETRPIDFDVCFKGSDDHERRRVLLDPPGNEPHQSRDRGDGWREIEMGEFLNENGDDGGAVVCRLSELGPVAMRGLIIQGIEFRPKHI